MCVCSLLLNAINLNNNNNIRDKITIICWLNAPAGRFLLIFSINKPNTPKIKGKRGNWGKWNEVTRNINVGVNYSSRNFRSGFFMFLALNPLALFFIPLDCFISNLKLILKLKCFITHQRNERCQFGFFRTTSKLTMTDFCYCLFIPLIACELKSTIAIARNEGHVKSQQLHYDMGFYVEKGFL